MSQSLIDAAEAGPRLDGAVYMTNRCTFYLVYILSGVAIIYAGVLTMHIYRMKMDPSKVKVAKVESQRDILNDAEADAHPNEDVPSTPEACFKLMKHISELVSDGAITFLRKEYLYLQIFCALFAIIIYFATEVNWYPFTTVAFIVGAETSMLCGYLGMKIATQTNWRTTYACNISIDEGFHVALKGGQVLGFALVGLALLILMILIQIYTALFLPYTYANEEEVIYYHTKMFECVAGYGLGGSTVALFGRVGGGIYTKAADVGADLAGKVCEGLEEDSP